ncbi:MAG: DNA internalization-related competence protein ComEC/Rec2 [Spongiibacteraceae bacterium]
MAIGVAVVAWLPKLPSLELLAVIVFSSILLAASIFWLLRQSRRSLSIKAFATAFTAFVLGIGWGCVYGYHIRSGLLPTELEQESLLIHGHIEGLIEQREGFSSYVKKSRDDAAPRPSLHFQFAIDVDNKHANFPRLIQLNWYDAEHSPQPGERWQLRVKLKRPRGFSNPGGFDYSAWLVANRIGATGYVEHASDNQRLELPPWYSIDAWRGRAQNYLQTRLQNFSHRDLLLGLLIGDGGAIDNDEWNTFRATGTVHLFVVSGLQIAFTGGLALWFARLWWRSPWCSNRRRHYVIGAMPALGIALLYALIAGWGVPIQRALIMFYVLVWALIARRHIQAATGWVLALWLVLLFDPLAVRDIGFWFSFVAVAAILLMICGHRSEPKSKLLYNARRWWSVQCALFVTSLPILLMLSGQITLLAMPANFIAIPLSTLLSLPLAFLALLGDFISPHAGEMIWRGADLSLDVLWRYLQWLQGFSGSAMTSHQWAIWQARGVDEWMCLFAVIAAALYLLPRAVPGKYFALFLLLPLFAPPLVKIEEGDCTVTVFDVGQGLSVLVETAQHRLLYDTGPLFGPDRAVADLTVVPALRQHGISKLDTVVISHSDNDHSGGWPAIARDFPVSTLLIGEPIKALENNSSAYEVDAQQCRAGMQWSWDNVVFSMLYPSPSVVEKFSGNNRSCVLEIAVGEQRILLTGDIERIAEAMLLEDRKLQRATLLLAPHHGSRSSSTDAFVERVNPQYVVFSAGYLNRFKHPSAEIVDRYQQHGATIFNTAFSGATTFTFAKGQLIQIDEYRKQVRHYWD